MYSVCVNHNKFENSENQEGCYLFFVRSSGEAQSEMAKPALVGGTIVIYHLRHGGVVFALIRCILLPLETVG